MCLLTSLYPNLYVKSSTKWWDGYTNQDVVLVDDLDSDALKHYIKIWAAHIVTGKQIGRAHV